MIQPLTVAEQEQAVAELLPKAKLYATLKSEGMNNKEICKQLGIKDSYGYKLASECNKISGINRKYSLTSDKLIKKAHKTVLNLMQGKPIGTITAVKDSTALAAASMVYDRAEPKTKKEDSSQGNTFVQINLNSYK